MRNNKRVLIAVADPLFSWENPNSAVVNYLQGIGRFLEGKGFEVDYFPANQMLKDSSGGPAKLSVLKRFIKSNFNFLYNSLRFHKYLKDQRSLVSGFRTGSYDCCIELLTFGSEFSLFHKDFFKKRIVIYDSPLEEQFVDLNGSSVIQGRLIRKREKEMIETADTVVCYSPAVKKYLEKSFSIRRVVSIPCIVWKKHDVLKKSKETFTVGFIGSFLKWHKVPRLVKAFELIASDYPNMELLLIGKGEEWKNVRILVDSSPYKNRISMTGFVSENELRELKSNIDVGVMPGSNWYGSPLKLFEYMEAGIPVIGPETPTVCTLFSSDSLLFIPNTFDPIILADSLRMLADSPGLRVELEEKGRQLMATEFAQEAIMGKFEELINQD